MADFNVYVIHSAKPLSNLQEHLEKCGGYTCARIIYKSNRHVNSGGDKEETKKTIVFCSRHTINQLQMAYPQYQNHVNDYNWDSFPVPNEENGETWNLHVSGLPNDFTVADAEKQVVNSLKCLISPKNSDGTVNYTVEFPPRLRETGEISGYGSICFEKHVDRITIKLCKLLLHNTPLSFKKDSTHRRMMTCVWHKTPKLIQDVQPRRILKNPRGFENARRARPAVQQVDVSNLTSDAIPETATSIIS
mgnify:CR=1 FL=1